MFFLIYIVAILLRYSSKTQKMLKTQCNMYVYIMQIGIFLI